MRRIATTYWLMVVLIFSFPRAGWTYHFFESTSGGCRWASPGSVDFVSDGSSTTDVRDTLLADGLAARSAWNDIATARDVFRTFEAGDTDFTDANFGTAWGIGTDSGATDGQNEIVLDETGDILRNVFSLDPDEVNGFGPSRRVVSGGACTITDAFNLLNGTRTNFDRRSTFVHEFGHIQGLAHSSVGMHNSRNNTASSGGSASPAPALDPINISSVPTMHPFSDGTGTNRRTPEQDDVAGLSELYPEDSFTSTLGSIQGTVRRCADDSPVRGVNVRAVSTTNSSLQVSRYSAFDGNGEARYNINGLPPGSYRIVVEPMGANGFTAGRMAIMTPTDDGFASEYYGPTAEEEADCTEATPDTALPVSVSAGTTTVDIDVRVGGAQLAFVVDDTGSMADEISAVRDILNLFVSALEIGAAEFPTTAIVTFKDNVTLRKISNDPDVLRGVINGLFASGGGDCPESSNAALLAAGRLLQRNGVAILFTDADSRPDGPTTAAVADLFRARGLTQSVLLSATCEEEFDTASFGISRGLRARPRHCAQDDGRPSCGGGPLSRPSAQQRDDGGFVVARYGAFGDEYREPPMLGFESAFETFSAIAAATGGTFFATPRPSSPETREAYVNAGANISISSVTAATALAVPGRGPQGATMNVEIRGANTNWGVQSMVEIGGGVIVNSRAVTSPSSITVNITIPDDATPDFYDVIVTTELGVGVTEVAKGLGAFEIVPAPGVPTITSIVPGTGAPGTMVDVTITGLATSFDDTAVISFLRDFAADAKITVTNVVADSSTVLRARVAIADDAEIAPRDVSVASGGGSATLTRGFLVTPAAPPIAVVASVMPGVLTRGATNVALTVTGANTNFVDGMTVATFGDSGVSVVSTTVTSATQATVVVNVAADAPLGFRDIFMTTGDEIAAGLDTVLVQEGAEMPTAFACDRARALEGTPRMTPVRGLLVTDAFEASPLTAVREASLCNAAMVDGVPATVPDRHLACFAVRQKGRSAAPEEGLAIQDQFGEREIHLASPINKDTLCVPAEAHLAGAPAGEVAPASDSYRCRRVRVEPSARLEPAPELAVAHEFGAARRVRVKKLDQVCSPAALGEGTVMDPEGWLACYQVASVPGQPGFRSPGAIESASAVATQTVALQNGRRRLCVPATVGGVR